MWVLVGGEKNMPPEDFQERLTHYGGRNRYDDPIFRIWWGQYSYGDGSFIAGGAWSVDEAFFEGYRRLLKASNSPCWCLGQWHDAIEYGSPEGYYASNLDEGTGLQMLGPYAYEGRVELMFELRWHEKVGNKLEFRSMPLTTRILDLVIPIIVKAREISAEKRIEAYKEAQRRDDEEQTAEIERHMRAKALPFKGAVSYGKQGIRSTIIDKKVIELTREWSNLTNAAKMFSRPGLQTR